MRRLLLTVAMLLMGLALVAGAVQTLFGTSLGPLDQLNQEVGVPGAAGLVLGIGLIAAAFRPSLAWVLAGILYGFVVLVFEAVSYFARHGQFHLGQVFFGLAFSLLLIALYPQRRKAEPGPAGPAPAVATPAKVVEPEPPPEKPDTFDSEPAKTS
jgi:hypothetical protein